MWLDNLGVVGASTWCLTLVRGRWAEEVLELVGAPRIREGSLADAEQVNVVAVRPIGDGWTLALEYNGWLGFVCRQEEVLAELSADGSTACAAWSTANNEKVIYAVDGRVVARYHPAGQRFDGPIPPDLLHRMTDAGLRHADDSTSINDRILTAMATLTGVVLHEGMLMDAGWLVGVGLPVRVRDTLRQQANSRAMTRWPDTEDFQLDGEA
jgi:hypothetical protein